MSSDASGGWWRRSELSTVVSVLLLGQLLSFILALLTFTSSYSASLGLNSPVTLVLFGYLALTIVYGSILLYRRHELVIPWYWYALIAFFDVQGNYLFNSAYYFTSITSVALLDCWTIAWVILLTWIFLGTKYSLWQFLGVALCGLGLCLVVLSDVGVGGGGGSNPLLGDILVIGATIFYALSKVGEEFCVKKTSLIEVLAMIGLFGTLFSLIEIAIFERKTLEAVTWSAELILTFVGNTVGILLFYTLTPLILQASGTTLFNLSLLTSDMWVVLIRIFFYQQQVEWLYYVSFAVVGVGLLIYSKTEKSPNLPQELEHGIPNSQYQLVHEQASIDV
ncbi:putative solute carrier family 35 member SLC35F1/F2/F6 [Helianthus annuus]|uniref:Solute carrier family 35 member SLC35F1/F2/F6 n=1 Tax=Helianthus annuus TaxID=4232 RepID=A0A251TDS5_HELAN|nr:solute carrier family 35 member F1 [Helianthus annuus]KAF5784195.1 putative solute carrier family 35 member SLC35F1/F2/F6 [Helianthus annuus]KAJ0519372.1 putative solute carrier family 35 member SLC35F1/F2/F6 [Helianthus annuus]KAJ0687377.1 putative solute carrier family 35 member SLC35F1/F2/F6 [Helianthus annuus]KAJ0872852.1 putative solute carrier family 35 member SLC35F1/F2/F6 [Helianthus annuus]KAJ0877262.1 putative solute carrier family 35 member SLC35F1/F2/F6 [Helianthus annuus]